MHNGVKPDRYSVIEQLTYIKHTCTALMVQNALIEHSECTEMHIL